MSSWNALVGEVNTAIARMNTAASGANAASTQAQEAAARAQQAAQTAQTAAQEADEAALAAQAQAALWAGMTCAATALDEDAQPTIALSEQDGVKHMTLGVPVGKTGAAGAKGETGDSGVTFTLTGSVLYINRQ